MGDIISMLLVTSLGTAVVAYCGIQGNRVVVMQRMNRQKSLLSSWLVLMLW
jgi:hypothetical protein